ncbi:MAG: 3-oxoacyl-[acyl-carrier-protein] reductase [Nitrospirota bacterium]
MLTGLEEKIAIVTGAGRGIGLAIATTLAERGASVIISDRDSKMAEEAAAKLSTNGMQVIAIAADVANGEDVKNLAAATLSHWGRVDILVNNAGMTRDGLLLRMKEEDWDAVISVNLKGVYHCIKAVLPGMAKQRGGKIISISSIAGAMGNAGQANYAASKAALIGLTKTIAREYASRGITANAVAPGFIDTAMTAGLPSAVKDALLKEIPLARLGVPEDIAYMVAFLASSQADYITGQVLHVNGGMYMGG